MPLHACQTAPARASQKPQKEKFHLIVRMMRKCDGIYPVHTGRSSEKFMAQTPGGHFDGYFLFRCNSLNVPRSRIKCQLHCRGDFRHTRFISITGASPQAMIEMGDRQFPAMVYSQRIQHVQQDH